MVRMSNFKMRTSIILFFWLFLLPFAAYAEIDPWYATQPSCVIKDADPGRTGNYNAEGIKEFHGIVWKTVLGKNFPSYDLLCYENKLFIGNKAYDEETGKLIWEVELSKKHNIASSVIYKGHLYLAISLNSSDINSNDTSYYFLGIKDIDIATKKSKMIDISLNINKYANVDTLAYNDVLFINFSSADLVAYSLKDNKILWHVKTKSRYRKLSTDGERLFTGYKNGIAAYDVKTGKRIWSFDQGGVDIIYKEGAVYTESMGGVWALNAKTGKVIWGYSPDNMGERGFAPLNMRVGDENIYLNNNSGNDNYLYALDRLTGKLKKKFPNLIIVFLRKDELYAEYRNAPTKENLMQILGKHQDASLAIQLPESLYCYLPKNKNFVSFFYDKEKKKSVLL